MELVYLFSILGLSNFIFIHRGKIYNILGRSKVGQLVMSPILIPYLIWGLFKLAKDENLIKGILEAEKQKKITDYFDGK